MKTHQVSGAELKVGDTIKVWWGTVQKDRGGKPGEDTITVLKPYNGSLKHLWKNGARLADFKCNRVGMTIDNDAMYDVVET